MAEQLVKIKETEVEKNQIVEVEKDDNDENLTIGRNIGVNEVTEPETQISNDNLENNLVISEQTIFADEEIDRDNVTRVSENNEIENNNIEIVAEEVLLDNIRIDNNENEANLENICVDRNNCIENDNLIVLTLEDQLENDLKIDEEADFQIDEIGEDYNFFDEFLNNLNVVRFIFVVRLYVVRFIIISIH